MLSERGRQRGEETPAWEHPAAFSAWLWCLLLFFDFSQVLLLLPQKHLLTVRHMR